jgi:hypothetical protein
MLPATQIEELITMVSCLDRKTLTQHFLSFRGNFPVDLTPEFLNNVSVDRLRHIFVALCLQNQRVPEMAA